MKKRKIAAIAVCSVLCIAVVAFCAIYGSREANRIKYNTRVYYSEELPDRVVPVYDYKDTLFQHKGTDFYQYLRKTVSQKCDDAFYNLNLTDNEDYDICIEDGSPNLVCEYCVYQGDRQYLVFDVYNYKYAILKHEDYGYLKDKITEGKQALGIEVDENRSETPGVWQTAVPGF